MSCSTCANRVSSAMEDAGVPTILLEAVDGESVPAWLASILHESKTFVEEKVPTLGYDHAAVYKGGDGRFGVLQWNSDSGGRHEIGGFDSIEDVRTWRGGVQSATTGAEEVNGAA